MRHQKAEGAKNAARTSTESEARFLSTIAFRESARVCADVTANFILQRHVKKRDCANVTIYLNSP